MRLLSLLTIDPVPILLKALLLLGGKFRFVHAILFSRTLVSHYRTCLQANFEQTLAQRISFGFLMFDTISIWIYQMEIVY